MIRFSFLAALLGSVLVLSFAYAGGDGKDEKGVHIAQKQAVAEPTDAEVEAAFPQDIETLPKFECVRKRWREAEARFDRWEKAARIHDLTRFIAAISRSSALSEQEQAAVAGPLALLLGKPKDINEVRVSYKIPDGFKKALKAELDTFNSNISCTAATVAEFYILNVPGRIKYMNKGKLS